MTDTPPMVAKRLTDWSYDPAGPCWHLETLLGGFVAPVNEKDRDKFDLWYIAFGKNGLKEMLLLQSATLEAVQEAAQLLFDELVADCCEVRECECTVNEHGYIVYGCTGTTEEGDNTKVNFCKHCGGKIKVRGE